MAAHSSEDLQEWDDQTTNRVGEIPMKFYNEYDHYGYNIKGDKLAKLPKKDELERMIEREEHPETYWKTVIDPVSNKEFEISPDDYRMIRSLIAHRFPSNYDPYEVFAAMIVVFLLLIETEAILGYRLQG